MTASMDQFRLAADFPPPSREQWRELVAAVLVKAGRGDVSDPEAALTRTTYDGLPIQPLYTAVDAPPAAPLPGAAPFTRGAREQATSWDVRARYRDRDPARVNAAILRDLEGGATSLWLSVGRLGIGVDGLRRALAGVYLDLAPVALDAGEDTEAAAEELLALAESPARLAGNLGADPIGLQTRHATPADLAQLARLAARASSAPDLRVATVDATIYHDAGASDADELAIATSIGVAYLRALTDAGLSVQEALGQIDFRFAVTAEQFTSIAKLRAARRLWSRVAQLSGGESAQRQHAVTSAAMMTTRDPWVNMLRTTIACFSAAVAGAEIITVLPYDVAIGVSDEFARRIARNTSAILHDESSLSRVVDAGGGSWYIESLSEAMAQRAWTAFTAIEASGGALAALTSGRIAEIAAATRAARARDVATRKTPITGVSEFALITEEKLTRPELPVDADGSLPPHRWAEEFERLRDRAEASPTRPTIFLAALGSVAAHTARLGFATNLFQAGGLEPVVGTGDAAELAREFASSGATVACLCGSDADYADAGADVAVALGARHLWLAGKADVAGVEGHIHVGCDAVETLTTVLDQAGVGA